MRDAVLACDHARPVTLVIANAGVSAGAGEEGESEAQLRAVMAVNLDGVLNTVLPLIPPMRARGRGQIALIGSLAGLRGLPSCPAYSASKMAVRALAEAWRGAYRRDGIRVCCVCPGYIATPMTKDNAFPMPFLMSAEKAARLIARGLAKDRGRIAFPLRLYLPLWWLCCLPVRLTERFFAGLPRKNAMKTEEAAL
jgi:NAD(P)-dependent dehydrogenase (short-subunit alcohol dehydrogenase family)